MDALSSHLDAIGLSIRMPRLRAQRTAYFSYKTFAVRFRSPFVSNSSHCNQTNSGAFCHLAQGFYFVDSQPDFVQPRNQDCTTEPAPSSTFPFTAGGRMLSCRSAPRALRCRLKLSIVQTAARRFRRTRRSAGIVNQSSRRSRAPRALA